jgi:hypothetical protein
MPNVLPPWKLAAARIPHPLADLTLSLSGRGDLKGTYSSPIHEIMPNAFGRCPGPGTSLSSLSLPMAWKHFDMCSITCNSRISQRTSWHTGMIHLISAHHATLRLAHNVKTGYHTVTLPLQGCSHWTGCPAGQLWTRSRSGGMHGACFPCSQPGPSHRPAQDHSATPWKLAAVLVGKPGLAPINWMTVLQLKECFCS